MENKQNIKKLKITWGLLYCVSTGTLNKGKGELLSFLKVNFREKAQIL
jgi:hypothetical protein